MQISLLTVYCLTASVFAAEYYVSPTGTDNGDGSMSRPLSLAKALGHGGVSSPAKPGDTVWLRGGTYTGAFEVHVSGAPGKPVIFRQYPGEHARLDSGSSTAYAINAMGDYIWFWGFEVFSSNTARRSSETGSFPNDIKRGPEIGAMPSSWGESFAKDVKFINMVLHDGWNPFMAKEATNTEVYGSIFYYQGWEAPDRGHGHSLYAQNANSGTKRIEDNIMFGAFSHGLHLYSSADYLYNFHVEGNVAFDNGAISGTGGYTRNYLIGWGAAPKNIVFRNNYAYYSPRRGGGAGLYFGSGEGCTNSTITGNYLAAQNGAAIELETAGGCAPTITGNTFYGRLMGMKASAYPSNTYYDNSDRPTGVKVFVRPNRYEPGRANIIVYNWSLASSVPVNVSSVLKPGDRFELRDAQNFFGSPLLTGTYDGTEIMVPMTSTEVVMPVGDVPRPPAHTDRSFGVFVLLPVSRTARETRMNAVVNPFTLQPGAVAPGSLIVVLGSGLSDAVARAEGTPLPVALDGTSLLIGGTRASLLSLSPERIEAQVPFEVAHGEAETLLLTGDDVAGSSRIDIRESAPVLAQDSEGRLLIRNQDTSLNGPLKPAGAGTTVTALCVGQGPVDPPMSSGVVASADPLARTVLPVSAYVGTASAAVAYAGLAPGLIGVCQVDIVVPNLASGDYAMRIAVGSQESNSGLISVAASAALPN